MGDDGVRGRRGGGADGEENCRTGRGPKFLSSGRYNFLKNPSKEHIADSHKSTGTSVMEIHRTYKGRDIPMTRRMRNSFPRERGEESRCGGEKDAGGAFCLRYRGSLPLEYAVRGDLEITNQRADDAREKEGGTN